MEERDTCFQATVPEVAHPVWADGSTRRSTLPARYHPVHAVEPERWQRFEQGLSADEADVRGYVTEDVGTSAPAILFNTHAEPDVRRQTVLRSELPERQQALDILAHPPRSFRKHLIDVPGSGVHCREHPIDELERDQLVEEVAHGVDEDVPVMPPMQRLVKAFGVENNVLPGIRFRPWLLAPAVAQTQGLGIAVLAAGRQVRAARDRVPRRVGPLDPALVAHADIIEHAFRHVKGKQPERHRRD